MGRRKAKRFNSVEFEMLRSEQMEMLRCKLEPSLEPKIQASSEYKGVFGLVCCFDPKFLQQAQFLFMRTAWSPCQWTSFPNGWSFVCRKGWQGLRFHFAKVMGSIADQVQVPPMHLKVLSGNFSLFNFEKEATRQSQNSGDKDQAEIIEHYC